MDMPVKLTNAVMKTRTFVEVFEYENMRDLTKSLFEIYDTLTMVDYNYMKRHHEEVPPEAWENPECEFWKSDEPKHLTRTLIGTLQMLSPNGIVWGRNPDKENSFGFMRSMEELKPWW